MYVGCNLRGFGASTMTLQQRLGPALHKFSKNTPPPAQAQQCEGGPICLSTAYQGAKTLGIHMKCMWDAIYAGLEPQT
jgi:hypothetical protein